jgi:hypothetical protein
VPGPPEHEAGGQAVLREVKRVELQLALLAGRLKTPA